MDSETGDGNIIMLINNLLAVKIHNKNKRLFDIHVST
jgi:hypothetical protein